MWLGHGLLVEGLGVRYGEGEGVEALEGIEVFIRKRRKLDVGWKGSQ